jgi:hypothetical protein
MPSSASVTIGGTQQFMATGHFSDGSTMDITQYVTWNSSNPTVADITNTFGTKGLATGFATGGVTISATLLGQTGSAMLTVM